MQYASVFLTLLLSAVAAVGKPAWPESNVSEPIIYTGICGGSAAAAIGVDRFIVADDEGNQLRLYHRDQGGAPAQVVDLTAYLELDRRSPETDIEGAARIGDRIFWMTSHSRNQRGKAHPNRYRFFVTRLEEAGAVNISLTGRPYKDLIHDLASSPVLRAFNFAAASRLPPKARGGLNIEGLCATPDHQLLIGFRNPIPNGKALLVPLKNPDEVIAGRRPIFGPPHQLDLNGLGIRDITFWEGEYRIIAGSYDGGGKSKMYRWSGGEDKPKRLKDVDLKGLNPEALVIYPDHGLRQIQLLSDDSKGCKDLSPAARQFRSVWVSFD